MPSGSPISRRDAAIPAGTVSLPGSLARPAEVRGVVAFAHGSGSSRHSPRNQYVASVLGQAGLGTLLFDLLTEAEAADRRNVFDIPLLSRRLIAAVRWLRSVPELSETPVGLFGASTGAGAALMAAAEEPGIGAVVSRGGRPDLAGDHLGRVRAPTLLIVGGDDAPVLALNEEALLKLRCEKRLAVVEGATHLFEEPGTLEEAARLGAEWFARHLGPRADT
ncbi:MAG TPA: alpha/beta family hydrolase [Phycisphaerales bacterium]|nr:alpha/beta family hydrolase [Phycisphaerales bacterium]